MTAEFSRSELVDILKLVEPALGPSNAVPQFSRFWFDGKNVSAYNDDIGISHKLETEFQGGIDGDRLAKVLRASKARKAIFNGSTGKMGLKLSKVRSNFALDDINHACWALPAHGNDEIKLDKAHLVDAIDHCMRSVGGQPSIPESLGITFEVVKDKLILYSSTHTAMSRAEVKLKSMPAFERLTVHKAFCEHMVRIAATHDFKLELNASHALLTTDEFGVFGRLMTTNKPIDFERTFTKLRTSGQWTPVPTPTKRHPGLKAMLERSVILASTDKVELTVTDAVLTIHSESDAGQMDDKIPFDHADVRVFASPIDIKAGCSLQEMLITEDGIAMRAPGKLYAISVLPK